jgi:hypothetical protein
MPPIAESQSILGRPGDAPDCRLGARDVPAKRIAGGAPTTPICAVLGQLVINFPCEQNASLRTGRGLPRSPSVIRMLARRVPYRLGAVDNGSAWMGDVVQDRPVMARFPRGLRPEAEKQLSGGAIRRNRAACGDAVGQGVGHTLWYRGVRVGCGVLLPVESPPHAGLAQPAHQRGAAHHAGSPARTAAPAPA